MNATSHELACYVVEPTTYDPPHHASLFSEIVVASLAPIGRGGAVEDRRRGLESFDLMTFPEAFLPSDALLDMLNHLRGQQRSSLFHVGLRPTQGDAHLYSVEELRALAAAISMLGKSAAKDISRFQAWVAQQDSGRYFNVACLFMIDADQELRVCIHPKNIPSTAESSALPDHNVCATDFVTVIVLDPTDDRLEDVYIQPLICSDVLDLKTSAVGQGPVAAITQSSDRFGKDAPKRIDVVSVATCTPLIDIRESDKVPSDWWWHLRFRDAFVDTTKRSAVERHEGAIFALSNFRFGPEKRSSTGELIAAEHGLSGCFVPSPPGKESVPSTTIFGWGRAHKNADDKWQRVDLSGSSSFQYRAQIVAIDRDVPQHGGRARLLRFVMPRLPHHHATSVPAQPTSINVMIWPSSGSSDPEIAELLYV